LTIQEVNKNKFRVQIIPETIARTNISHWTKGYQVNIETDYLLKAVFYRMQDLIPKFST
ncbi:MAG: riboflavin synthase, partial [Candidatus Hydrogenedentota bacterium]